MDRDTAYIKMMRVLEEYRALPYSELLAVAGEDPIESQFMAQGELVTLAVYVRRCSENSVRVVVSACGDNWRKLERLDESVVVHASSCSPKNA